MLPCPGQKGSPGRIETVAKGLVKKNTLREKEAITIIQTTIMGMATPQCQRISFLLGLSVAAYSAVLPRHNVCCRTSSFLSGNFDCRRSNFMIVARQFAVDLYYMGGMCAHPRRRS
jgi:hypothetical protein